MSLVIRARLRANIVVIELTGRLAILESGLLDRSPQRRAGGHLNFAINLEEVAYIDASGLGQLLETMALVTRRGGELILVRPSKRVLELLAITKLDTIFEIFEDVSVPLKSVGPRYQAHETYA